MNWKSLARSAWVVLVLLLAALAGTARAQLLSPGPLSKAHTSLEGDAHCADCHSSGKSVDPNACLHCHTDLGARISAGQGLHGLQYKGRPCEGCHVEHLGVSTSLTRWPGGDPSKFDHALTGWALEGAHRIPCSKCHNKPNSRGNSSYLTTSKTCTSCHKDVHDGRFGTTCATCHDATSWTTSLNLEKFDHDLARFQLRGAHRSTPCAKCHSDPPKYVGLKFGACVDCHKDPHNGQFGNTCTSCHDETKWRSVTFTKGDARHPGVSLANGHAAVACVTCHDKGNLAAPSKGSECVSCHRPVHEAPFGRGCAACHASIQWLGLPRSIGLTSHVRTAYPLTGKHVDVPCADCHKPSQPESVRFRKLTFSRCGNCHQDQHRGEFASQDHGECKACHSTAGFRPTLFDANDHASTHFPLAGKHVAAPCSSCHTSPRPRLDLHLTKQACADCHANPHGDKFAKEMAQGGCAQCHEPRAWDQPKIDHSTWPLTGAHATAACDSCHHPTPEDRKAGSGPSYRGVPRACSGCHDDAHLGQFRLTQPVLECDKCHSTKDFKVPNFDHLVITGWALTGAHEKTACDKCHMPAAVAGERPVVRYRGVSTECKFCHANPHERHTPEGHAEAPVPRRARLVLAALAPAPAASPPDAGAPPPTPPAPAPAPKAPAAQAPAAGASFTDAVPCEACHTTAAWKAMNGSAAGESKFDHSTTGFPLTGQHIHTPCAACHKSAQPVKRACASCHSQDDVHRGRLLQGCDSCHVPAGWRVTRPIEIHQRTRFPLTGMHTLADCTECHLRATEQKFTDAPIDCYGCHAQDYRRPGIFPVHVGSATSAPLPRDCSLCHRAIAWVPANVPAALAGSIGNALQVQTPPRDHDIRFPISFGSHRGTQCNDCHASLATPRAVRCIGCHAHDPVLIQQEHRQPVASDGASCLSCHPGGARR
jgi:hypothetical protein